MKRFISSVLVATQLFMTQIVDARGRIQNEDVKSLADIQSAVLSTTGNLASGSACIVSPGSTAGLGSGIFVYDSTNPTYIPSGTTVVALPGTCSAGQVQMSANATHAATGDTLTFGGQSSQLINDTKIWMTSVIPAQQLSSAVSKGLVGGGGGSKNYLSTYTASNSGGTPNPGNGNFEQASTNGWSLAHSALSSLIPTSVASPGSAFSASSGGTPASGNLSLNLLSSNVISGNFSGSLVSSAASTAGDMLVSNPFFIDEADQLKILSIAFNYDVITGLGALNFSNSSSNTYAMYVYDVTNGVWISPQNLYSLIQTGGTGFGVASFQTPINGLQFQLAIVNINASTGGFALAVDDFFVGPSGNALQTTAPTVGPQTTAMPPAVTVLTSGSGTYTVPSNPSPIWLEVEMVGGGGGGSGGSTVNDGALGAAGTNSVFGTSLLTAGGAGVSISLDFGGVGGVSSVSSPASGLALQGGDGSGGSAQGTGATASGNGGSSAFGGAGGGNINGSAGVNAKVNTGGGGQGGMATTGGQWFGGSGGSGGYVKAIIPNPSSSYTYTVGAGGAGGAGGTNGTVGGNGGSGVIKVTAYFSQTAVVNVGGSDPLVAASYITPTSSIGSSDTAITYSVKVLDTNNAFNTSTGVYTIPVNGTYRVTGAYSASMTTTAAPNSQDNLRIFLNGSNAYGTLTSLAQGITQASIFGQTLLPCKVGDTISIMASSNATSPAFQSGNFTIERVGN